MTPAKVKAQQEIITTTNTDYTKGLLLLAVTEEAVWLQCKIDALYWNLVQQGKRKLATEALRRGQLEYEEDKRRIF